MNQTRTGLGEALPFARKPHPIGRMPLLLVLGAASAAAWHWRAALDPATIAEAIGHRPAAPLLFLVLQIAASLLFVPRTILAAAAGLVFGIAWGIVWAAAGSVLGAMAGFWLARYVNSGLLGLERNMRLAPILDRIERGGWRGVALLRLIPVVPHSLTNYALGLTPLPVLPYAFGSLVGQLPMTIACVELGAAGERLALGQTDWLTPTVAGAAALVFSLVLPAVARRRIQ